MMKLKYKHLAKPLIFCLGLLLNKEACATSTQNDWEEYPYLRKKYNVGDQLKKMDLKQLQQASEKNKTIYFPKDSDGVPVYHDPRY